jgi:hypothetical protein
MAAGPAGSARSRRRAPAPRAPAGDFGLKVFARRARRREPGTYPRGAQTADWPSGRSTASSSGGLRPRLESLGLLHRFVAECVRERDRRAGARLPLEPGSPRRGRWRQGPRVPPPDGDRAQPLARRLASSACRRSSAYSSRTASSACSSKTASPRPACRRATSSLGCGPPRHADAHRHGRAFESEIGKQALVCLSSPGPPRRGRWRQGPRVPPPGGRRAQPLTRRRASSACRRSSACSSRTASSACSSRTASPRPACRRVSSSLGCGPPRRADDHRHAPSGRHPRPVFRTQLRRLRDSPLRSRTATRHGGDHGLLFRDFWLQGIGSASEELNCRAAWLRTSVRLRGAPLSSGMAARSSMTLRSSTIKQRSCAPRPDSEEFSYHAAGLHASVCFQGVQQSCGGAARLDPLLRSSTSWRHRCALRSASDELNCQAPWLLASARIREAQLPSGMAARFGTPLWSSTVEQLRVSIRLRGLRLVLAGPSPGRSGPQGELGFKLLASSYPGGPRGSSRRSRTLLPDSLITVFFRAAFGPACRRTSSPSDVCLLGARASISMFSLAGFVDVFLGMDSARPPAHAPRLHRHRSRSALAPGAPSLQERFRS